MNCTVSKRSSTGSEGREEKDNNCRAILNKNNPGFYLIRISFPFFKIYFSSYYTFTISLQLVFSPNTKPAANPQGKVVEVAGVVKNCWVFVSRLFVCLLLSVVWGVMEKRERTQISHSNCAGLLRLVVGTAYLQKVNYLIG